MRTECNCKIGRNSRENWELLAEPGDHWWFHLESFPSPYVILGQESPSQVEIRTAAELCKQYSKYRNYRDIYVIFTQVKYVKKGTVLGEAIVRKTKRIKV